MNSVELLRFCRGQIQNLEMCEAAHFGSIAVVEPNGRIIHALGDVDAPTHLRSTAKPFQILPFMLRDLDKRYHIDDADIALLMASHGGEPFHVEQLQKLLTKIKVASEELQCGIHAPMHEGSRLALIKNDEKPSVLHNNCSGKHSAMLATCKAAAWDCDHYLDTNSPLQQEIMTHLLAISGAPQERLGVGIDGCSAPTFILPLKAIAQLYANLAQPRAKDDHLNAVLEHLFDAGTANPDMIAGHKRLDTLLMQSLPGQLFAKTGAEGVYAMALKPCARYPSGLGIAIKIDDGDSTHRARNAVATALLVELGVLTKAQVEQNAELAKMTSTEVKNLRGFIVGSAKTIFRLATR